MYPETVLFKVSSISPLRQNQGWVAPNEIPGRKFWREKLMRLILLLTFQSPPVKRLPIPPKPSLTPTFFGRLSHVLLFPESQPEQLFFLLCPLNLGSLIQPDVLSKKTSSACYVAWFHWTESCYSEAHLQLLSSILAKMSFFSVLPAVA